MWCRRVWGRVAVGDQFGVGRFLPIAALASGTCPSRPVSRETSPGRRSSVILWNGVIAVTRLHTGLQCDGAWLIVPCSAEVTPFCGLTGGLGEPLRLDVVASWQSTGMRCDAGQTLLAVEAEVPLTAKCLIGTRLR